MLEKCDLCGAPFGTVMYDCSLPTGSWGNICHPCFLANRCKLGVDRGQKYKRTPSAWVQVKGGSMPSLKYVNSKTRKEVTLL